MKKLLLASLLIASSAHAQAVVFDCEYTLAGSPRVVTNSTDARLCEVVQQLADSSSDMLTELNKKMFDDYIIEQANIKADYLSKQLERKELEIEYLRNLYLDTYEDLRKAKRKFRNRK